ncbi:MAG: GNAT family N-acetyltransferase [Rhodospirillaceae bacterium]|nr:GNAT family N-acetyltransferase [Rhodospirillaceae bacterium]
MADIIVRAAAHDDADAIRALTREAYSKWIAVSGREPLPMKADYALAVTRHRFDLLFIDGELAALIETSPENDALLVVNLAVRPAHQRQGYGTRLLRLVEDRARQQHLKALRLFTNKLFTANIQYYQALGYGITREEELNGGIAVHLSKPL